MVDTSDFDGLAREGSALGGSAHVADRPDFDFFPAFAAHIDRAVIPARKRGTPFSPDDPALLGPLLHANLIFAGPGSPTYAVRQFYDSRAWHSLTARHRLGADVVLASATTTAAGTHVLPVYEIYKVGEDLHWCPGLDFFGAYGLALVIVPHWNNAEGGAELDTRRCFMGEARFAQLVALLPHGTTVVGIDEHTALAMDFVKARYDVMGRGGITVMKVGQEQHFSTGQDFSLATLGTFRYPNYLRAFQPMC